MLLEAGFFPKVLVLLNSAFPLSFSCLSPNPSAFCCLFFFLFLNHVEKRSRSSSFSESLSKSLFVLLTCVASGCPLESDQLVGEAEAGTRLGSKASWVPTSRGTVSEGSEVPLENCTCH